MNPFKNLPKWAQTLIALLLIAGGALSLAWHMAPPVPRAVTIIGGFCGIVGGALGVGILPVPSSSRALLPLVLAPLLALSAACTGAEWRAAAALREAGTLADRGFAAAHKARREACAKEHGVKTGAFVECVGRSREREAMVKWRTVGRPAVNAGLISLVTSLTIYEQTKGRKLKWADVVPLLKPIACALSSIVAEFKALLGAKAAPVLAAAQGLKGVTCAGR